MKAEPFYADRYLEVFDRLMRKLSCYEARIYIDDTLTEWLRLAIKPQPQADWPAIRNVIVGLATRRREMMRRRHA